MEQRQVLSFGMDEELYALPLEDVREIIRLPHVTRLPGAPSALRGVANLRGAILPLVDLREALGLPPQAYGKYTVVIVAETMGVRVGLVVDRVADVLSPEIEQAPAQLSSRVRPDFVAGLARAEGSLLVALELSRILNDELIGILRTSSAT
jgi:purine-binding chemotaxis protein CheW